LKRHRLRRSAVLAVAALATSALLVTGVAGAQGPPWVTVATDFESPLFGLAVTPGKRLVVADAGAGPTLIRHGTTRLLASLPGVTDVAPLRSGAMFAVTGGPDSTLYRVSRGGRVTEIADLQAFEEAVDPAGGEVGSNPFDLARWRGKTLVADAQGNSLLVVNRGGKVDWVATLPLQSVSTQPLKDAVGCPDGPPDICNLPPTIDADPVPTSVAIGPDGYAYVGELTGFPATPGESRIWRIDPRARHAKCGSSPACSIVETGPFTSIIDLSFRRNGTAYVVELDEASWLAVEEGQRVGGTVNACVPDGTEWNCTEHATELPIPTAVAIRSGRVYATLFSLVPGQAQVARLP
jgi:hypothetical protein